MFSVTMVGLIVAAAGQGLRAAGFHVEDAQITQVVTSGITVAGGIIAWYGRYRQGDITFYGRKLK